MSYQNIHKFKRLKAKLLVALQPLNQPCYLLSPNLALTFLNTLVKYRISYTFTKYVSLGILLNISDANGKISIEPSISVVMAGSKCTLSCRTDNQVTRILWHFKAPLEGPMHASEIPFLFNGFSVDDTHEARYRVKNSDGHFDLEIDPVDETQAGTYTCQEAGSQATATSEVVVLRKQNTSPIFRLMYI